MLEKMFVRVCLLEHLSVEVTEENYSIVLSLSRTHMNIYTHTMMMRERRKEWGRDQVPRVRARLAWFRKGNWKKRDMGSLGGGDIL